MVLYARHASSQEDACASWPIATVFPFLVLPNAHIFLKPNVTRKAARAHDFPFNHKPAPPDTVYESLRGFGAVLTADLVDLQPRDMIDVQSFIWVLGSEEYDKD